MAQSIDLSCREFVEVLASSAPAPGGGGAAALAGALATALGNMVGSLTVGKARYADVQDDIAALNARAQELEQRLLALVARDAEVFEPLAACYRLPKETEEQRAYKQQQMEDCLAACCQVPLEIMVLCEQVIGLCAEYAAKGSRMALSDAGCGAALARGALQAASLNVYINTASMTDRACAAAFIARTEQLLASGCAQADELIASVTTQLRS